jgi:hypothetical protein
MFPGSPPAKIIDCAAAHREKGCESINGKALHSQPANLKNLVGTQYSIAMALPSRAFAACSYTMKHVFPRSDPLQVVRPVVLSVSILVIAFMSKRARSNKGLKNKRVDVHCPFTASMFQTDLRIAMAIGRRRKQTALSNKTSPGNPRTYSANAAEIGDFVDAFKLDYGFPDLVCVIDRLGGRIRNRHLTPPMSRMIRSLQSVFALWRLRYCTGGV